MVIEEKQDRGSDVFDFKKVRILHFTVLYTIR